MNFDTPAFRNQAWDLFRRMDPWQEEAVLDAIEQMLPIVLPPAVARRMPLPFRELYDGSVIHDGRQYYVFLSADLEPDVGLLSDNSAGVSPVP